MFFMNFNKKIFWKKSPVNLLKVRRAIVPGLISAMSVKSEINEAIYPTKAMYTTHV